MIVWIPHGEEDRMSSIDASERRSSTDEIRRIREEYEQKAAENAKRKNKEIKAQSKNHQQELAELRDTYESQLQEVREKQGKALSQRDQKHQADVEQLRRMYLDSITRKTEDNQLTKKAMTDTFEQELGTTKRVHDEQKRNLQESFKKSVGERDQALTNTLERSREEMRTAIEQRADKLRQAHAREMQSVQADRNRQVTQADSDVRRILDATKSEVRDLKAEKEAQIRDRENRNVSNLRFAEDKFQKIADLQNMELQQQSKRLNQDSAQRLRATQDQMQENNNQLREQVNSRIDNQLRAAEADARQAKQDQVLQAIASQRIRNLEREDLVGSYEDRFKSLEKNRLESHQAGQAEARRKIEEAVRMNEKLVREASRDARVKQNVIVQQNREARAGMEAMFTGQIDELKERSDKRVRNIVADANATQATQAKAFDENLEMMRARYLDNLQAQREAQLEQLKDMQIRMEKRMRETEAGLHKKVENINRHFEGEIAKLEDSKRDLQRSLERENATRLRNRDKAAKMEQESLTMKYESRLGQLQELQRQELERQEKRHQEQMASLAARANANLKKA